MQNKLLKLNTENIVMIGLFLILLIYPLMTTAYDVLNLSYFLTMVLLSISVSLVWGYGGIFSFGQALFFGLSGYFYAILTMNLNNAQFNFIALMIGVLFGALIATVIGYFIFYGGINDVFVGLITLCLAVGIETFLAQTAGPQWKIGNILLGGFNGINGIPTIQMGSFVLQGNSLYYFILLVIIAVFVGIKYLMITRYGYALIAIRENRDRTQLLGYNVPKYQLAVFALGGAIAALGGILYAIWGSYLTPATLNLTAATLPIVLVAAAGRKNLSAGIIFTLIYYWGSQQLAASGNQYALIILGVVLIVVMLFVPNGLIQTLFSLSDKGVSSLYQQLQKNPKKRGALQDASTK